VSKIGPISPHPRPDIAAPNSVSGSARDHIALRGPESPLCSAISASVIRGPIVARNCSVSVIDPTLTSSAPP